MLVNVGNQLQAWSDGRWRSTKHRVTNPAYVTFEEDTKTFDENVSTRRVSVAFFHKANYDAAVDAKELLPSAGSARRRRATSRRETPPSLPPAS